METHEFQELIWGHGRELYRDMPWRRDPSPYEVLVSELMLQQTQVSRVIPKFEKFMQHFPTIQALASASLADVLVAWSGLGYNRRAKYLWQTALELCLTHNGELPDTYEELMKLPGIGPNTAAAICNYAYRAPTPFVETNIRTVYFHHFFHDKTGVSDKEILKLVELTMPQEEKEQPETRIYSAPGAMRKNVVLSHYRSREWFWALMDYGAHLKSTTGARLDQSKHYKKQSPLTGSIREMRGRIIRVLTNMSYDEPALRQAVSADERFERALVGLQAEGMIMLQNGHWSLAGHKG